MAAWTGPADPRPGGNRSTVGVACLTPDYLSGHSGSKTTEASRYGTAGYDAARAKAQQLGAEPSATINACHLIGDQLAGDGTNTRNLVSCTRAANSNAYATPWVPVLNPNMMTYENRIAAAVSSRGQTVAYVVVPEYIGDSVIPFDIKMTATCIANCTNNPINISDKIENKMWSPSQNLWVNIGQ